MKGPKGRTDEFYGFIKSRKRSIFVIDSYLDESAFTSVKMNAKLLNRYVKGVPYRGVRYNEKFPQSLSTSLNQGSTVFYATTYGLGSFRHAYTTTWNGLTEDLGRVVPSWVKITLG